jgi:hypothetical protein
LQRLRDEKVRKKAVTEWDSGNTHMGDPTNVAPKSMNVAPEFKKGGVNPKAVKPESMAVAPESKAVRKAKGGIISLQHAPQA